jgi:hypothetical protein
MRRADDRMSRNGRGLPALGDMLFAVSQPWHGLAASACVGNSCQSIVAAVVTQFPAFEPGFSAAATTMTLSLRAKDPSAPERSSWTASCYGLAFSDALGAVVTITLSFSTTASCRLTYCEAPRAP